MSLPSLDEALARMLAACAPLETEAVPIDEADGRVLARTLSATRDQPPFDASSMDGWAVHQADLSGDAVTLSVIGESVAGRRFDGTVEKGQAVRIFTGAPLPPSADRVVIQERATVDGDRVTLTDWNDDPRYVRDRGGDFRRDEPLVEAGVRLHPGTVALLAAAGCGTIPVFRRPRVAVLATGDELARPGSTATDDQVHDSIGPALVALIRRWGGIAQRLPAASDRTEAVVAAMHGVPFDVLVTIGGASVGDHDVVKPALASQGLVMAVEGVALRPGRPVWFGMLPNSRRVLGLPGNPASALVCAEVFLRPILAAMSGHPQIDRWRSARLVQAIAANGWREQLMRGRVIVPEDGTSRVIAFDDQDSAWVSVMARSDALIRREAHAPALETGADVLVLPLTGQDSDGPEGKWRTREDSNL